MSGPAASLRAITAAFSSMRKIVGYLSPEVPYIAFLRLPFTSVSTADHPPRLASGLALFLTEPSRKTGPAKGVSRSASLHSYHAWSSGICVSRGRTAMPLVYSGLPSLASALSYHPSLFQSDLTPLLAEHLSTLCGRSPTAAEHAAQMSLSAIPMRLRSACVHHLPSANAMSDLATGPTIPSRVFALTAAAKGSKKGMTSSPVELALPTAGRRAVEEVVDPAAVPAAVAVDDVVLIDDAAADDDDAMADADDREPDADAGAEQMRGPESVPQGGEVRVPVEEDILGEVAEPAAKVVKARGGAALEDDEGEGVRAAPARDE